tara:strand:+ start:1039 stop:2061 length:1023 start_codon:yes stop_codon:yes gene_type:complete
MRKLLILLLLIPLISFSQNNPLRFSTFYGAINGGTSISDVEIFSVTNGLEVTTVRTPYDYNITLGIRKIARFGYENKAQTFYDGTETSWADGANIGKRNGLEYLFEATYKRQMGEEFVDQNHFVRWVDNKWILKGEYLQDGFADISYFETSERYRLKLGKLSFNIGAAQRLSEPYGYNPLDEWLLDNGGIHYTYLALQEGYNVDVYHQMYYNPNGELVANNSEVWEAVVIPEMLSDYTERKRGELDRMILQSLVLGFDFYHYKKNIWLHSWGNIMPYHYNDGSQYAYHKYNDGQWLDYSGGLIFGYKINKSLGTFLEGKYNKYWNREWYDFKLGVNYTIF